MHSINLDLLRASAAHFADGRPRDPHAHHRAQIIAMARAARRDFWRARVARLRVLLVGQTPQPALRPCTD